MRRSARTFAFRGVRVVDPDQAFDGLCDVLVRDGLVQACSPGGADAWPDTDGVTCFEGARYLLTPCFVDLRSRFGEPGFEYREGIQSGLRAATAGGYSHVCCLGDTDPCNDSRAVTELMLEQARAVGGPRLHAVGAATRGMKGGQLSNLGELAECGVRLVGDADRFIEDAAVMRRVLEYCKGFGLTLCQQPQDPNLAKAGLMHEGAQSIRWGVRGIPAAAELIALVRDITLAELTEASYHASCITTAEGVSELARAKSRGADVSADVAIANLALDLESAPAYDRGLRLHPPPRSALHREALLAGVESGDIDAIVSNHQPNSKLETDGEFEQVQVGAVSIEQCFSLVWELVQTGQLSATAAIGALSTRPARILGLSAPALEAGSPANFNLIDTEVTWKADRDQLESRGYGGPFLDCPLRGKVLLSIADGEPLSKSCA